MKGKVGMIMWSCNRSYKYLSLGVVIISLLSAPMVLAEPNTPAAKPEPPCLNPNLKFPTLQAYEAEIESPGIMLDSNYVCLFAPKEKAQEAGIIFKYLIKAYDELYRLVGRHTEYKIVVYHFPEGNPHSFGGTSNCTIWYGYKNLNLESDEEWKQYHVPHVSGYIEEMAHNFVHSTHAQFGWEMIGWTIGTKVANKVAGNPLLRKNLQETRQTQIETFKLYQQAGCVFPGDIPANLCDRIHAYILWQCEQRYGQNFWRDFFKEINKEQERLLVVSKISDSDDRNRNNRYRLTIECLDRLPGLDFKNMLKKLQISLTTDVKSLHLTEANWNRKFVPNKEDVSADSNDVAIETGEAKSLKSSDSNMVTVFTTIDPRTLPPLHQAAYDGKSDEVRRLIEQGADVQAKGPNGLTALHIAAMRGHQRTAQLLLDKGASIHARDDQGHTAADIAEMYVHDGMAKMLRDKEASYK